MDVPALMVRVKQLINKPNTTAADDTGKPNNAEILAAINEAYVDLYSDVMERLPERATASTTLQYPGNIAAVTLPAVAQDAQLLHVYFQGPGANITTYQNPLAPLRIREFVNAAETGTPLFYAVTGNDFRLRPVPTTTSTVTLFYLPTPATMVSGNTPEDSPVLLPAKWHQLIAYKAAIAIRQINEDPAGGLLDAFQAKMDLCVASIERRIPDNHVQMTEPQATAWQR